MMDRQIMELLETLSAEVVDLKRRMENIVRIGRVIASAPERNRVRVRFSEGDLASSRPPHDSAWLRVLVERDQVWDFPRPGEQVMVISPGGELGAGYVDRSLHSSARPQPSTKSGMMVRKYPDGLECSYDTESHSLVFERPEELNVVVKGTYIEFQTEKAAIKNKAGISLFGEIAKAFKSIFKSKTATMMGPQALLPAATELPKFVQNIDSFGEDDAA